MYTYGSHDPDCAFTTNWSIIFGHPLGAISLYRSCHCNFNSVAFFETHINVNVIMFGGTAVCSNSTHCMYRHVLKVVRIPCATNALHSVY